MMESRSSRANRRNEELPQLSCDACRNRKVKCDKLNPCSNCISLCVTCIPVHRLRLPRGRHVRGSGGVSEDLKRRIKRLEALVAHPAIAIRPTEKSNDVSFPLTDEANDLESCKEKAILIQQPGHFWADLAEEIHGLRDVLNSAPDDTFGETTGHETLGASQLHRSVSFLGLSEPQDSFSNTISTASCISSVNFLSSKLCHVYLQQVDPMVKVLHRPSICNLMIHGGRYLEYPVHHPSVQALRFSVSYAAANSLTEKQCEGMFQTQKSNLVADCRKACESAIERSDILNTRDITVLQAFVLYLVARRSEERNRSVWTLLALAVRIAKALSLNVNSSKETFFYRQMKRRLWLTICLMDIQCCFGQASQPLISLEEAILTSATPAHVNDSDFGINTGNHIADREELTDTTFSLVTYKLQLMGRHTNFSACEKIDDDNHAVDSLSNMQMRQHHVIKFEEDIMQLIRFCDPESSTYAWFVFHSAQCFVAGARACILRPLQRLPEGCQQPPPRRHGDAQLLRLAVQNLEKALLMHTDSRGEGFRWYVTVQWHVLAIVLAECYICTDASLVRKVWPIVEGCYRIHEKAIALGVKRLLDPLEMLFNRTLERVYPTLLAASGCNADEGLVIRPEVPESELTTEKDSPSLERLRDFQWADEGCEKSNDEPGSTSLVPGSNPSISSSVTTTSPNPLTDDFDWIWDKFLTDISFDDLPSPDMFFGEPSMGGI